MRSLPNRNKEGLRRVCEDQHYAFMSPLYGLLTNAATCALRSVPRAYIQSTKAMVTVKGSPYKEILRQTWVPTVTLIPFVHCAVERKKLPENERIQVRRILLVLLFYFRTVYTWHRPSVANCNNLVTVGKFSVFPLLPYTLRLLKLCIPVFWTLDGSNDWLSL
jgi:hypothetical protein